MKRSAYDMSPVMQTPVIFVSGVPGAGCNTVSQTLAAITGYHVIIPGELLRKEAADITTPWGMRISRMLMDNNVPEEIIVDLVKENMLENIGAKGFILCGFPKNKKMANIYKRDVNIPAKVISLQVADEVATMRLQQKLTELGKPEAEVLEAEEVVRNAAPKIKKVTDRFKKNSLIMVNSSLGNIDTLNETLHAASESFKEFKEPVKNETTEAPQDYEGFDEINLPSSSKLRPLVSTTPLASHELMETIEVLVEPRQSFSSVEVVEPVEPVVAVELDDAVKDKTTHIIDSVTHCLLELHTENLEKTSSVNIINDEVNILHFDRRAQIPA